MSFVIADCCMVEVVKYDARAKHSEVSKGMFYRETADRIEDYIEQFFDLKANDRSLIDALFINNLHVRNFEMMPSEKRQVVYCIRLKGDQSIFTKPEPESWSVEFSENVVREVVFQKKRPKAVQISANNYTFIELHECKHFLGAAFLHSNFRKLAAENTSLNHVHILEKFEGNARL